MTQSTKEPQPFRGVQTSKPLEKTLISASMKPSPKNSGRRNELNAKDREWLLQAIAEDNRPAGSSSLA
jgi:hypothetical protein